MRECDYKLSPSDPNWVLASGEHGLSFSLTMRHAVNTINFLGQFQKKGTKVNCAYWILEDSSAIPEDMEFVQVTDVVFKLCWIAQRVAVMSGLTLEAYKDA